MEVLCSMCPCFGDVLRKVWLPRNKNSSFTTCLLLLSGLFGCCKPLLSSGCSDDEPGSTLISIQVHPWPNYLHTSLFHYLLGFGVCLFGIVLVHILKLVLFSQYFFVIFKKVKWGRYYVRTPHSWSASGKMASPFPLCARQAIGKKVRITISIPVFLGMCSWIQNFAFLKGKRNEK